MGFQFKNIKTGYVYYINEIDEIASKFWNKEVHPNEYAYPGTPENKLLHKPNWFDMIGHSIENLQYFVNKDAEGRLIYKRSLKPREAEFDMSEVASLMLNDKTRHSDSTTSMFTTLEFIKPYIELCFHLKSLDIVGVGRGWW